jgi:hypothetical protein
MNILSVVNANHGAMVRVQTTRNGYTEFKSNAATNHLLIGRVKNYEVECIEIDKGGFIHIYSRNYNDYNF